MCFSASVSFGAGAVLFVIGVASIKKAKTPSQFIFASIPLIFAVQQITEGFLWLALSNPDYAFLKQFATYNFLFFAQVVWPVWAPFSILKLEPKERQSKAKMFFVAIGSLVSLYLAYCLLTFQVEAKIVGHHISYVEHFPASINKYGVFLYVIVAVVPPFLSRIKRMWLLGSMILVSYIITAIFYEDYVISVWCFFAAIISIAVFVIVSELNDPSKKIKVGNI
jgi:hypothetical protein